MAETRVVYEVGDVTGAVIGAVGGSGVEVAGLVCPVWLIGVNFGVGGAAGSGEVVTGLVGASGLIAKTSCLASAGMPA